MRRILLLCCAMSVAPLAGQGPFSDDAAGNAARALRRATSYFRGKVSVKGSYLWEYSEDLAQRRGEGPATATQGWVQPPGTPSVGMAYIRAHEATGEPEYLDAARETARALARTQLASGGWDYRIEFHPQKSRAWHYRRDVEAGGVRRGERRSTSTYDDNTTQSALRFLMRCDRRSGGADALVGRAVEYGLEKLLEAQYPSGAWPQRYSGEKFSPGKFPIIRASYPQNWSRTHPGKDYRAYYTFNDNAIQDVILTLLEAHRSYGKKAYLEAARRGGDFILLAQMPEPQRAWAQQYNARMEPAWARKFEPPSIVSAESAGVVRSLLDLFLYTGDEKYFNPILPAAEWFRRSRLESGHWARFYELRTNRPLYFTRKYELVYTSDDLPTHYSFQGGYGVAGLLRTCEEIKRLGRETYRRKGSRTPGADELRKRAESLKPAVRRIISRQDRDGRWVSDGMVRSRDFIANVEELARFIAFSRGRPLDPYIVWRVEE